MVKQALSDSKVYVAIEYKNWDITLLLSVYSVGHNRSSGTTTPKVLFKLLIYKLDKVNHWLFNLSEIWLPDVSEE